MLMRILLQDANLPIGIVFPFTKLVYKHQIKCHLRRIKPLSSLCDFRKRNKASVNNSWNKFENLALDIVGAIIVSLYTSTIYL